MIMINLYIVLRLVMSIVIFIVMLLLLFPLASLEAQNDQLRVAAAARSLQREEQRELQGKAAMLAWGLGV